MLSRRNARIKTFQTIYSREQSQIDLIASEKNLKKSFDTGLNALLHNLMLVFKVAAYAELDKEIKSRKLLPTDADREVSVRILENPAIRYLRDDESFARRFKREKVHKEVNQGLIKELYDHWVQTDAYRDYARLATTEPKDEVRVLEVLVRDIMAEHEFHDQHMEELFYTWHDDYEQILLATIQVLEELVRKGTFTKYSDFQEKNGENYRFARDLMMKAVTNEKELTTLIEPKLRNWDLDRVAMLDLILMRMALTEILYFPTIPVKVTINEYVDISKWYSTPKSREFINGILDNLMKELKESGKINKTGRGLVNN